MDFQTSLNFISSDTDEINLLNIFLARSSALCYTPRPSIDVILCFIWHISLGSINLFWRQSMQVLQMFCTFCNRHTFSIGVETQETHRPDQPPQNPPCSINPSLKSCSNPKSKAIPSSEGRHTFPAMMVQTNAIMATGAHRAPLSPISLIPDDLIC